MKRLTASPVLAAANALDEAEARKEPMIHIRISSELHRTLRLIVAARDTCVQQVIAPTRQDAMRQAWPATGEGTAS